MHFVSKKKTAVFSGSNYFNYSIHSAQKFVPKKYFLPPIILICFIFIVIQFSKWPRDEIPKHSREI